MSTSYYRLMEPFTSLRLEENAAHDKLTVWENGANCGTLVVAHGVGRRLALRFAEHDSDEWCPLRTHWGGAERGAVVTVNVNLPLDATVVSEYGDILTVAQVMAREGAKRSDGMPTELMGYQQP